MRDNTPFAGNLLLAQKPAAPEVTANTCNLNNSSASYPASIRSQERYLYLAAKRAGDVTAAALMLLLIWPLFGLIALLVWVEDGGPAFYAQTRVGKGGRHFRFYKFRTMVPNAESLKRSLEAQGVNEATGPIFKMKNDPRVTRVGRVLRRYSLDELPQLLSVLRGDMSVVGPRPHLPSEVTRYTERQRARLLVQPGLLCWREVSGRSNLTFERWVESDLSYVENRSLRTDLAILWRAVPAVLKGEGAY